MLAVAGQTIGTSAYDKVSVGFVCLAKKFINIALTVGDMNTSFWSVEKVRRMTEVRQPSMGTRVGLIFFLSALEPLNFFLVQNLMAAKPRGSPSVVTTRLECIRIPQTVRNVMRPFLFFPLTMQVEPISSGFSLFNENSVVS
jgi:hypothetical protein